MDNWDLWISLAFLILLIVVALKYPGENTWDDGKDYD
jgi:hypothetical protein